MKICLIYRKNYWLNNNKILLWHICCCTLSNFSFEDIDEVDDDDNDDDDEEWIEFWLSLVWSYNGRMDNGHILWKEIKSQSPRTNKYMFI